MTYSRANRGKSFEEIITPSIEALKVSTIVKTDPPVKHLGHLQGAVFKAVYTEKGQCDYEGCFLGDHWCIEAKETRQEKFYFAKNIKKHQIRRLTDTVDIGGMSALLLRFWNPDPNKERVFLMDWRFCIFYRKNHAFLTVETCRKYPTHPVNYGVSGDGTLYLVNLERAMQNLWRRAHPIPVPDDEWNLDDLKRLNP